MDELSALRYIVSMIVSSCHLCDEQQFQTLPCVHYTTFSVGKLDLFIRVLDHILALEIIGVQLAYILLILKRSRKC